MKDVPTDLPKNCTAITEREDPRDIPYSKDKSELMNFQKGQR